MQRGRERVKEKEGKMEIMFVKVKMGDEGGRRR